MTATSTSPTATSTTSRSSTPAATRPTATRSRARTRSGRTAGTPASPAARRTTRRGGAQIGDTGLCVGDYTIQPENGGISVFAHEYGHDLGLPDQYDTSGAPVENGVNWWTIMAQSRVSKATDGGIGEQAADFGAWDKLQLGWLDYEIVAAGQNRTARARPARVQLEQGPGPGGDAAEEAAGHTTWSPPAAGTKSWWSGEGNNFTHTMNRQVALPAGQAASLTFQANWDIEDCGPTPCDYAYVEVNDGTGYKPIAGTITKRGRGQRHRRHQQRLGAGDLRPVGVRRQDDRPAVPLHHRPGGRRQGLLRRRDQGDLGRDHGGHVRCRGLAGRLDAERLQRGRAPASPRLHDNYYLASNINYVSYDQYLQTGPYNFGFGEHAAGQGRALPVPGRPAGLVLGHLAGRQQHQRAPR